MSKYIARNNEHRVSKLNNNLLRNKTEKNTTKATTTMPPIHDPSNHSDNIPAELNKTTNAIICFRDNK